MNPDIFIKAFTTSILVFGLLSMQGGYVPACDSGTTMQGVQLKRLICALSHSCARVQTYHWNESEAYGRGRMLLITSDTLFHHAIPTLTRCVDEYPKFANSDYECSVMQFLNITWTLKVRLHTEHKLLALFETATQQAMKCSATFNLTEIVRLCRLLRLRWW
jgi:hypothetical protein